MNRRNILQSLVSCTILPFLSSKIQSKEVQITTNHYNWFPGLKSEGNTLNSVPVSSLIITNAHINVNSRPAYISGGQISFDIHNDNAGDFYCAFYRAKPLSGVEFTIINRLIINGKWFDINCKDMNISIKNGSQIQHVQLNLDIIRE